MDPSLTLRTITDDEILAFGRAANRVFLETSSDEEIERFKDVVDPDRYLAVTDPAGDFVGTAGGLPTTISLPGADAAPCAGVTIITVRPDHRRRGLLRSMMNRLLHDAAAAGEPFAALFASEGTIYGRFGFGPSAPQVNLEVSRDALATVRGDTSIVHLVDHAEAERLIPPIFEAHRRQRGGMLRRNDAWVRAWLGHNREKDQAGEFGARWHAVVEGRGYATYRAKDQGWPDRRPDGILQVEELVATDPEARAALWAFLASVDLVVTIRAGGRPVDDPLPFLVDDEAAVNVKAHWPMWLRLVDLPTALAARGYRVTDRLVLEVDDDVLPANAGRWRLDAAPDGATCKPTDEQPDVTLPIATLATLFLGGYTATRLADAGRLPGAAPDVVARLDGLFAVTRAPWQPFDF